MDKNVVCSLRVKFVTLSLLLYLCYANLYETISFVV